MEMEIRSPHATFIRGYYRPTWWKPWIKEPLFRTEDCIHQKPWVEGEISICFVCGAAWKAVILFEEGDDIGASDRVWREQIEVKIWKRLNDA